MFKIITDSTADLPKSYLEEHGVGCINLSYIVDGVVYGQGQELECKKFYDMMREGKMPTTSQVNPEEAKHFLEEVIKTDKEVIYLAFSSGLSGTYNSARIAAEEIMEEHPDCKIEVIDTLAASMGEGLMVHMAVKLRDEGKSLDEVVQWLRNHIKNFVHIVTVDDLFHLHRGGRVSKASAVLGTLAGIKPIIHVDDEGHLIVINKIRGRKKSLSYLVDYMEEKLGSFKDKNDAIFIGHGDCLEDAEMVRDMVKERFGYEKFLINNIGPVIGSHTGPGVMTIFFMGESR